MKNKEKNKSFLFPKSRLGLSPAGPRSFLLLSARQAPFLFSWAGSRKPAAAAAAHSSPRSSSPPRVAACPGPRVRVARRPRRRLPSAPSVAAFRAARIRPQAGAAPPSRVTQQHSAPVLHRQFSAMWPPPRAPLLSLYRIEIGPTPRLPSNHATGAKT